ncbi:hypothetical protein GGI07_002394 [Coemansia sp. Benny D115]|nr:hypothetical protein GGI07_002394 [Coemansia sp. Benny D115]
MDGKDSAETSVISSRKIVNLAANVKTSSASDKINNSNNNNGNEDDNNGDNGDGGDGEEENNAKNKSQDTKSKGKSSEEKKPSSNTSSGSFSGRLTYYNPANGACGGSGYGDDDMVAALNAEQYGDVDSVSDYCGKCAQIEGDKATIVVKIIDACEGCGYGALDLSPSAFKKVTSDDGVSENVSWSWVDC